MITIDYLRFYVASIYIIIGTMMDRGVIWSNRNDGAMMIMSHQWNANFGYIFTQASPGA
jgi:hypothetical protein